MTDKELQELISSAKARYNALDPHEKKLHDWEQCRSFVRGQCPSSQDYAKWCESVDKMMLDSKPSCD